MSQGPDLYQPRPTKQSNDAGQLKRGTGKYSHIVLLPQPSDDPCDPLNWPRWKKEACFFTVMFTGGLFNTVAVLVSSAYVLLAEEFHVSVNKVVSSFCGIFLGSAIFVLIQNPLAVKFGHRVVYLISAFLMFISCVWSPLSTDLVSISASRVLQGAAMAPLQCLVPVTIEHIYFVHERGSRSSIWGLFQFCAPIIGGVINTYVTQKLSWKLGFWFTSIACGLCFLGVIFFVPETTYNRQSSLGRDSAKRKYEIATPRLSENNEKSPKLPTFLSQVKIYSGTFSEESIWKIFLRPFPFLLSPVTWFIFVSVTMPLVCTVFLGLCTAMIFTITYGFNATDISLTGVASFVGIIPALIVAGPLSDRWIVWMAQRNRGIYEPEYRLVFMLCMLVGVFSFIGWAIGYERHMPWIGAVGCATMMTFSIVVSYTVALAYVIDTHGADALHVVTLNDFAKYVLGYGATFFANGLVLAAGVRRSLLVLGGLYAAFWLAGIPMYVCGKRARSFIARHPRLFRRDLPPGPNSTSSRDSLPCAPSLGPGSGSGSESKGSVLKGSTSGSEGGEKAHA